MTLVLLLVYLLLPVRRESGRIGDPHFRLDLACRLFERLVLGKKMSFGERLRVSLRV